MSLIDLIRKGGSTPKCSAVIVAAGSSVRMGFDKLTAPLGSASVLLRTLRAFEASENVGEIVVVTRADRIEEIAKQLPGLDCGSCGSPTCRALAEDIVCGYARELDCLFLLKQKVSEMAKQMVEISELTRE